MRATLARDRLQDCGLALPSYRWLDERGDEPEISAWRGICAQSLGLMDEADAALARAVALGVSGPLRERVDALRDP